MMKRIIFGILAVGLGGLGAIGAFFGLMFRMDPGEESTAFTHDVAVGLILAGACFLAGHAIPGRFFRTYRSRFLVSAVPSLAVAIIIPTILFSWQKSILEARKRNARAVIERAEQERLEQQGAEGNMASDALEAAP